MYSLRKVLKEARESVMDGNPLEADALMKNFCEVCFDYRTSAADCQGCALDAYLNKIMPLCAEQRGRERMTQPMAL
jgi:hypothetical protein